MRSNILFFCSICAVLVKTNGQFPYRRFRRDSIGALDIVTNNAQPIHADVKLEGELNTVDNGNISLRPMKPCPKPYVPSSIEMGVVFQSLAENDTATLETTSVTPPRDVTRERDIMDEVKRNALRRSYSRPNKLNILRNDSRIITLVVLVIHGIIELYGLLKNIFY